MGSEYAFSNVPKSPVKNGGVECGSCRALIWHSRRQLFRVLRLSCLPDGRMAPAIQMSNGLDQSGIAERQQAAKTSHAFKLVIIFRSEYIYDLVLGEDA
jgi:hypothetical protein